MLAKFGGVLLLEQQVLQQLKAAICELAAKCLPSVGAETFALQEDAVRGCLAVWQTAAGERARVRARVAMLEGQLAFWQRPNVRVEVYKQRMERLGQALEELQRMKDALPPNVDSHESFNADLQVMEWAFQFSFDHRVQINYDQQRRMYAEQIAQAYSEIETLPNFADASDTGGFVFLCCIMDPDVTLNTKEHNKAVHFLN